MKKMLNFFLPKQKFSADGSTTLDSLKTEKQRLETRLTEIPRTVANLQNSVNLMTSDITWLEGLNNRRKKDWEKENGKSVEQAVYDARNQIVDYNAQISGSRTSRSSESPGNEPATKMGFNHRRINPVSHCYRHGDPLKEKGSCT
jgi:hypothetical protein